MFLGLQTQATRTRNVDEVSFATMSSVLLSILKYHSKQAI